MRALVKVRPGRGLELRDVPEPRPARREVLLQVEASGVCGSDIARYVWTRNYARGATKAMEADLPRILGHEFAGSVIGLGPEVDGLREGDRVAVRNLLTCGKCRACQTGNPNVCDDRRTLGVHRDGGYAQRVAVPAANCTPLPDDLSFHMGAALQPFAVATHAVRQAQLGPGDRVAVWGLGPVGISIALAARLRGLEVVAGYDLNIERVEVARRVDIPGYDIRTRTADAHLLEHAGERTLDALFDAAGAFATMIPALSALRRQGPVVLVGNLDRPVEFDPMPMIMDEQRLLGSRSYSMAAWHEAVRTIGDSGIDRTLDGAVDLESALDHFELSAAAAGRPFTIVPTSD